MARKLSILIVEDDQNECKKFIQCIDELEDVSCVGTTNNSFKALELFKNTMPDAIILDLELNAGGGNGLLFLKDLQQQSLDFLPYILITTNNTSSTTYEFARKNGADFIMSKQQTDYSAKNVIDFLRIMKTVIIAKIATANKETFTESTEQKSKRITRKICNELNHVGVSPKFVGYQYLVDAINIIIKQPENHICNIIATKYGKTASSVERAMQNAINRAWHTSDINDLLRYYTARINQNKGVPTLTEFIYYYANKIKNEY